VKKDLTTVIVLVLLVLFSPTIWWGVQAGIRALSRLLAKRRAK
jgi:choline-glycine betaine transporter